MPEKKPLWTCPKCGHQFVTPNMWHSCSRHALDDHFKDKELIIELVRRQLKNSRNATKKVVEKFVKKKL